MFQTKKKKVINYLNEKNMANAEFSPFDVLLSDYMYNQTYILTGFRITNIVVFRESISNIMWIYRLSQQRFRLDVIRMNRMSTLYFL